MVQVIVKRMTQADEMKIPWKHCSVQGPPQGQQLSLCPQRPFQWIHRPLALPRRRQWQPTPMFLPGESQGRGSLVGCCLWGRTEPDTAEAA